MSSALVPLSSVTHLTSWVGMLILLVLVFVVGFAVGFVVALERAARHVSRARRDS